MSSPASGWLARGRGDNSKVLGGHGSKANSYHFILRQDENSALTPGL